MKNNLWRTKYHTINGFRQFYRDRQPRDESVIPVLALHGSLTQSGMWVALAEAADSFRMLCPDQRGFGLSEDPGNDSCAEFAGLGNSGIASPLEHQGISTWALIHALAALKVNA
jgi:pimeloyl-ACP methyl ester carboxylesterase